VRAALAAAVCTLGATMAAAGSAEALRSGSAVQARITQAAEPGGPVTVLSLDEAIRLATEHNPQYRQAVNRLDLTGARLRQGWAAFLPTVNVGYTTGQNYQRQPTYLDLEGRPTESTNPTWVGSSSANLGVSANFTIFDGGATLRERHQIQAEVRSTRLGVQEQMDGIIASVETQYRSAQRQKAQLALEVDLLAAQEQDLEVVKDRFEYALVRRHDVLEAEFLVEQQRAAVRESRGAVETALIALRVAVGDPALGRVDVDESVPEPRDPATLSLQDLLDRAMQANPAVGTRRAQVQTSEAAVRAVDAQWWPRISGRFSLGRYDYRTGTSALFDLQPGNSSSGTASWDFNLSIPVFDGFQRSYNAASARVDLRNAHEDLRQAELQLELDVRTRFADLTTAWENLRQRDRALEIAAERLELVREEYQLGNVDIQQLRSAITDEARARRDALDQRFECALALLDLYQTAGIVGEEAGVRATRIPG